VSVIHTPSEVELIAPLLFLHFRKLEYFRSEQELFREDVARYIANPLNAFAMIKRATIDLSLIIERLSKRRQPVEALARYRIKTSSLAHAVKCLLLIQRIYKLPTDDIARGIINNRRIGDRMTTNDLFVMGSVAANLTGEEFLAREYLDRALEQSDRLGEVDESAVRMKIVNLCEQIHDYKGAALQLKELLMKEPDNSEAAEYVTRIVKLFQTHGNGKLSIDDPFRAKFKRDGKYSKRKEFELISDVCRGERKAEARATLQCRYISSAPFVRFKVEEVNRDPHIVLIVDVLSDAEIQSLKEITAEGDEKSIYDAARVAELYDKDSELVARISSRIEVGKKNFAFDYSLKFSFAGHDGTLG
jgi:prolyl 4-hydroxylase